MRRSSSSRIETSPVKFPAMTDNLLYDMDSSTGCSSSDSDGSPGSRVVQVPAAKVEETPIQQAGKSPRKHLGSAAGRVSSMPVKQVAAQEASKVACSLKAKSAGDRSSQVSSKQKQVPLGGGESTFSGDPKRSRKLSFTNRHKNTNTRKRSP